MLGARLGLAALAFRPERRDVQAALAFLAEEEGLQPGRVEVAALRKEVERYAAEQAEIARDIKQAEEKEQEAKQRAVETKAKLQAQLHRVGAIECRTISYDVLETEIGDDIASVTANGVFVGVLVKCTNIGKRTASVNSPDFALVDAAKRRYEIDRKGSYYYAVTGGTADNAEKFRTPEFLQLHPGVPSYIALVFDLPTAVASQAGLALDFRRSKFSLTFPSATETKAAK
ncbi:MAG: DUF4352 domain-containing protein [Deltaproteobacteria bacterium]|nr:DUF4352 domain-containing protein [Deltaproteobacteria bacterium]